MSGKAEGISPIRKSRLKKKRRRQKEDGSATSIICALQNLSSTASSKQSRRSDVGAARGTDAGHCKENLLNGRPSYYPGRASVGQKSSEINAGGGLDANALQRGSGSPLPSYDEGAEGEASLSNTVQFTLGFMDAMDSSALLSAIPSMLEIGIDMARYKSGSGFRQDIERAFEYKMKMNNADDRNPTFMQDNAIYHSLVGRIDPHSRNNDAEGYRIAFPPCRSSCSDATTQIESPRCTLFEHLNLTRKTEHGMCIPSSWYQFPNTKAQKSQSVDNMISMNCDVDGLPAKMNRKEQSARKSPPLEKDSANGGEQTSPKNNEFEQFAARKALPPGAFSANQDESRHGAKENGKNQSTLASKSKSPPSTLKYQGKIRILSDRGATIREVFDIDKSKNLIGKLYQGDERYFIEKKTLPPPAISLVESDEESEDDCVAVVRYKIALKPADCASHGNIVESGWISDRGRFADDDYVILGEI